MLASTHIRVLRAGGVLLILLGIVHLAATPHISRLIRHSASAEAANQQLMSQLAPQQQIKLREEQRAWIKWRDQEAARLASDGGAVGGSAYRVDYSNAQLKLIRERTEVLRHRLKKSSQFSNSTKTPNHAMQLTAGSSVTHISDD
jgi:hypothetical protein